MTQIGTFPFGQPITTVKQVEREQKNVFVLGVYGSAVHARWIGPDGKQRIKALAVASEPKIFWTGGGAKDIIGKIHIQKEAGHLEPAGQQYNGPSGRTLKERFLNPLQLSREKIWLCDLIPHSLKNPGQKKALCREYYVREEELHLPKVDWLQAPTCVAEWEKLVNENRRRQIVAEIEEASPDILITLGDKPLRWFTQRYCTKSELKKYGKNKEEYGRIQGEIEIGRCRTKLLPLVHPRQTGRLGTSSKSWSEIHDYWVHNVAPTLNLG